LRFILEHRFRIAWIIPRERFEQVWQFHAAGDNAPKQRQISLVDSPQKPPELATQGGTM
jgi:hypothetical protein